MKIGPPPIVGTPDVGVGATLLEFKTKTIVVQDADTLLADPELPRILAELRELYGTSVSSRCYLGGPVYGISGYYRKKFEDYSYAKRFGHKFLRYGFPYRVVNEFGHVLWSGDNDRS